MAVPATRATWADWRYARYNRVQTEDDVMTDVMGLGLAPLDREVTPNLDAALVEATRRRNWQRMEVLETCPSLTIQMLAEARGQEEPSIRAWLSRRREANRMVTVSHRRRTYIPSFQFDHDSPDLELREDVEPLVARMLDAEMSSWALWIWWVQPNTWLEAVPIDAVDEGRHDEVVHALDQLLADTV